MSKHYVIALQFAMIGKKTSYSQGEIVSIHHNDDSAAFVKAGELNKKITRFGSRHFAAIECDELLKKGDIRLDLVEQWEKDEYDRSALYTMELVLRPEITGEAIDDSKIADMLAGLKITIPELRERYEDAARKSIAESLRIVQETAHHKARRQAAAVDLKKDRQEITFTFPAVRGIQATREYYVAQVPYGVLAKLFVFDEEDIVPAEFRAQRTLSTRRAQDISDYVLGNAEDYVLPALTASVSKEMAFEPIALPGASDRVGMLHIPLDATLLINDGQHRRKGIELAIAQNPALKHETIAVTIYYDRGLERSQQMFADINARAVKPSSAINALYDRRNPFNTWVLDILDKLPEIKRRIDFENASPGAKSHKLWSLVSFKRFVTLFSGYTEKNIASLDEEKKAEFISVMTRFFSECKSHIPQWAAMIDGHVPASEVREQWVIGHAVWLEALGMYGKALLDRASAVAHVEWDKMARLSLVDPLKTSSQWAGRCVVLGKMQKTTDGVKSSAAKLMQFSNMSMSEDLISLSRKIDMAAGIQ